MITSSKAIPASQTETGMIYKRNGINCYFMRVTFCGSVRKPDEGYLFITVEGSGSAGVIQEFNADTMFKQVNADLTIDD